MVGALCQLAEDLQALVGQSDSCAPAYLLELIGTTLNLFSACPHLSSHH
jgi:hypothetical protein